MAAVFHSTPQLVSAVPLSTPQVTSPSTSPGTPTTQPTMNPRQFNPPPYYPYPLPPHVNGQAPPFDPFMIGQQSYLPPGYYPLPQYGYPPGQMIISFQQPASHLAIPSISVPPVDAHQVHVENGWITEASDARFGEQVLPLFEEDTKLSSRIKRCYRANTGICLLHILVSAALTWMALSFICLCSSMTITICSVSVGGFVWTLICSIVQIKSTNLSGVIFGCLGLILELAYFGYSCWVAYLAATDVDQIKAALQAIGNMYIVIEHATLLVSVFVVGMLVLVILRAITVCLSNKMRNSNVLLKRLQHERLAVGVMAAATGACRS